jgi:hypothetical protein
MSGWLRALLLALGLMVGSWALLVLLARRLPPGLLRDLASIVPDCVTTLRRLRRDPRVPRRARVVVALAGLWLLSPIDLLPEFLPVIGNRRTRPRPGPASPGRRRPRGTALG